MKTLFSRTLPVPEVNNSTTRRVKVRKYGMKHRFGRLVRNDYASAHHSKAKLLVVLLPITFILYYSLYEQNGVPILEKQSEMSPLSDEQFWNMHFERKNATAAKLPLESEWISKDEVSMGHEIPRIIHKVYVQKSGGFQDKSEMIAPLKKALNSWKERNPNYRVQYFDLHRCRAYLSKHFHPLFLRSFDCIEAFSGKVNLFRLAVLYREGGFYSDWRQVCLVDGLLDMISANGTEVYLTWDRGHAGVIKERCIQNCFLGAIPRHPLFAEALRQIFINIQGARYGPTAIHNTGPCLLGKAYRITGKAGPLSNVRFGYFTHESIFVNNKVVVKSKCHGCGTGQDWKNGNNYNVKHRTRDYYCEDAATIFSASESNYLK